MVVNNYWAKGVWPANSPDLSLIENVWDIMQDKVDDVDPPPKILPLLRSRLATKPKSVMRQNCTV